MLITKSGSYIWTSCAIVFHARDSRFKYMTSIPKPWGFIHVLIKPLFALRKVKFLNQDTQLGMKRLKTRKNMLKKLKRHEVAGDRRVIKIVKALSEEVVEAFDISIRRIHQVENKTIQKEKIQGRERKAMENEYESERWWSGDESKLKKRENIYLAYFTRCREFEPSNEGFCNWKKWVGVELWMFVIEWRRKGEDRIAKFQIIFFNTIVLAKASLSFSFDDRALRFLSTRIKTNKDKGSNSSIYRHTIIVQILLCFEIYNYYFNTHHKSSNLKFWVQVELGLGSLNLIDEISTTII